MDDDTGICGRNKEIKDIYSFIASRVESKRPGVLYLTGPPGTGKSMSIQFVLDKLEKITVVSLNCLQAQSSKVILSKICSSIGLDHFARRDESTMVACLTKKFTGRTCETHLIVLDEMDRLPKSKNKDLIKKIFSWPSLPNSKLILIGIANTINLTSRYEVISEIIGRDLNHITKIIFKPYSSKDIKSILQWYLDNDENFEDASLEPRVLDMISAKFARDKNGDIRSALNALKSTIDDSIKKQPVATPVATSCYLTPPTTPPSTPCKERTNCTAVADSIRKRQRSTHYKDDAIPHSHEVILTCILRLCSGTSNSSIDLKTCRNLIVKVSDKYGLSSSFDDIRSMLDNLVMQGLIEVKRGRPFEKIVLKSSENELTNLIKRKNMIMDLINTLI